MSTDAAKVAALQSAKSADEMDIMIEMWRYIHACFLDKGVDSTALLLKFINKGVKRAERKLDGASLNAQSMLNNHTAIMRAWTASQLDFAKLKAGTRSATIQKAFQSMMVKCTSKAVALDKIKGILKHRMTVYKQLINMVDMRRQLDNVEADVTQQVRASAVREIKAFIEHAQSMQHDQASFGDRSSSSY